MQKLKSKDIAMATNAGVYLMLISWHSKTEQIYLVQKQFTSLNKFYPRLLLHYLLYLSITNLLHNSQAPFTLTLIKSLEVVLLNVPILPRDYTDLWNTFIEHAV